MKIKTTVGRNRKLDKPMTYRGYMNVLWGVFAITAAFYGFKVLAAKRQQKNGQQRNQAIDEAIRAGIY